MALFRRGKRGIWWYEFVVHARRYRESTGTASETLAQKIERKRHRELEAASGGIELQRVRPVLFGIAADDWLKVKEPTLADKTRAMYAADVGHLKPHFAKLLLTDIAARDVSDYVKARRRDGVADKSIRNELGTLRSKEAPSLGSHQGRRDATEGP